MGDYRDVSYGCLDCCPPDVLTVLGQWRHIILGTPEHVHARIVERESGDWLDTRTRLDPSFTATAPGGVRSSCPHPDGDTLGQRLDAAAHQRVHTWVEDHTPALGPATHFLANTDIPPVGRPRVLWSAPTPDELDANRVHARDALATLTPWAATEHLQLFALPEAEATTLARDLLGAAVVPLAAVDPASWVVLARLADRGGPAATERLEDLVRVAHEATH